MGVYVQLPSKHVPTGAYDTSVAPSGLQLGAGGWVHPSAHDAVPTHVPSAQLLQVVSSEE
jgi:hypothetical protein